MIEKFIKWLASAYITRATVAGYNLAKREISDNRDIDKLFEMKELLGKKVITISNEWEDMMVGTVVRIDTITQAKQPILVIKDCFSGTEYMSFGQVYVFNVETLNALLKLTPYERWNLKVPQAPVSWNKTAIDEITPPAKFRQNLKTIGFI